MWAVDKPPKPLSTRGNFLIYLSALIATALAASLVPTTLAGHRYWEVTDEQARAAQRIHFLKNTGMLGGLILAATDLEGRPSLSWRARRAAKKASHVLPTSG